MISFIVLIIVVAILAWAFNNYVVGNLPMDAGIKGLVVGLVYFLAIYVVVTAGLPMIGIALPF